MRKWYLNIVTGRSSYSELSSLTLPWCGVRLMCFEGQDRWWHPFDKFIWTRDPICCILLSKNPGKKNPLLDAFNQVQWIHLLVFPYQATLHWHGGRCATSWLFCAGCDSLDVVKSFHFGMIIHLFAGTTRRKMVFFQGKCRVMKGDESQLGSKQKQVRRVFETS